MAKRYKPKSSNKRGLGREGARQAGAPRAKRRIQVVSPGKAGKRQEDFKVSSMTAVRKKGGGYVKGKGGQAKMRGPVRQLKAGYKFSAAGTVVRDPNKKRVASRRKMQRRRRV